MYLDCHEPSWLLAISVSYVCVWPQMCTNKWFARNYHGQDEDDAKNQLGYLAK